MTENVYQAITLNPYLEDLVQYIAENYTQRPGDNMKWYKVLPEYSGKGMIAYGDDAFTHKDVVGNWVEERAKDVITNQNADELEAVGVLNKPFGLNGFKTAEIGTVVYQKRDRYIIKLFNDKANIEVPFYKETLAPNIDFYNEQINQ